MKGSHRFITAPPAAGAYKHHVLLEAGPGSCGSGPGMSARDTLIAVE